MTSLTYGGTALSSFGKVTLIDDCLDQADRVGDNIKIPLDDGELFTQKHFGGRIISVGIAVIAATATALETAMDNLRKLLAPRAEQTLAMTMEDASVRNISATVNKSLQVSRFSDKMARVVVQFDCAHPFWRSNTLYEVTSDAIDGTPTPQTLTVANSGTAQERNPTFLLTGPLRNTVFSCTVDGVLHTLTYTGTIAAGTTVTIGKTNKEYYATHSVSGSVIGNVSHSGSTAFMVFATGNNSCTIADADYGGGTCKVSFYTPYA